MLASVLVGLVVVGLTVAVHALGTSWWIGVLTRRAAVRQVEWRARRAFMLLTATALVLLLLHVLEVLIWAITYQTLAGISELATFADALYFSFVTFTTLGYGDITLGTQWRLLSGIEAMNGILLFGWSTAMLFAGVQRLWTNRYSPRENGELS